MANNNNSNNTNNNNNIPSEPNPPVWPASVKLIHPTDSKEAIAALVAESQDPYNTEYKTFTSDHHFTNKRFALLFHPGTYSNVSFEVGYYTQVLGLGQHPDQVQFTGEHSGPFSPALNGHVVPERNGTCLDTFWKSAENFAVVDSMTWAVSQAAPLRNVHVHQNLHLFDGKAYASGGHLANSRTDGMLDAGTQQQFLYRHVEMNGAQGGAWSLVHVGCTGHVPAPSPGSQTAPAHTHVAPRVRLEKPFVAVDPDDNKLFQLHVPRATTDPQRLAGVEWAAPDTDIRDFARVRVVAATEPHVQWRIQQALDWGLDVVLSPGIYTLEENSLHMKTDHQVLLGLGLATLEAPKNGAPCIYVHPHTKGVRIGGIMLEASEQTPDAAADSSLLQWGSPDVVDDVGDPEYPGGLFDVFCRVGGATLGDRRAIRVHTMVRLHSGHIVGDNLWLWRADHAELRSGEQANYPDISTLYHQSEQDEFRVENGLIVTGPHVTIYGLAVEHANEYQTKWSGEDGLVAFYQSEFPYGVTADRFQFPGYLVEDNVQRHHVHAPGIYSNFRNEAVPVKTAVQHGDSEHVRCTNPFTVKLDNNPGIDSIVNDKGLPTGENGIPMRLAEGAVATALVM